MGDSGNEAIHINAHKMKTHGQNQLKIAGQVYFKVLFRTRYNKPNVMMILNLSNAPLKSTFTDWIHNQG